MKFTLARLQNSKDDISFSLHAEPTSFTLSGLQPADLLATVGFARESCSFIARGECLAIWVPEGFPIEDFASRFPAAFDQLETAERHLTRFGLLLPRHSPAGAARGDGHSAPGTQELKQNEDENFYFLLSFIEGGRQKGWVYHYRPKHPPLSKEVSAALSFLDLPSFHQCPWFDFESCNWQFFQFQSDDRSLMGTNAQRVHDAFALLPEHFSLGIEALVKSHSIMADFGFPIFDIETPTTPKYPDTEKPALSINPEEAEFDVAISFAGPQRSLAEELATIVRDAGYVPFFDGFYPSQLWGKDLIAFFDEIYRKKAKYCVMFISQDYSDRIWTNHERKSAQARALQEKGKEYLLPIRIDDTELPGLVPTIGYLSIEDYSIEQIAELLIEKLKSG
jgi:hypothetical protein